MLAPTASTRQPPNFMSAIKHFRERLGLSQQRLADAIGMSLASIRNYEAGAVPSREALAKLRALSPKDFDSIFAKSSDNKRAAANEHWHRILESILNSNRSDLINALKTNLVVFNRIAGEQRDETPRTKKPLRHKSTRSKSGAKGSGKKS